MGFSLHCVNNIFTSNVTLEGTPHVNHTYGKTRRKYKHNR